MDLRFSRRDQFFAARREEPGRIVIPGEEGEDPTVVTLQRHRDGSLSVVAGNTFRTGEAVRDGDIVWVRWRGRTYRLTVDKGGRGRSVDGPAGDLDAPMPGVVLRHLCAPGDVIEAGAPLLVLEAMKMQIEIKAPRAGVLTRYLAGEGETVPAGAPLAEVESDADAGVGPAGETDKP